MMDESTSPIRRRLLGGCALLLLCGGVALLTLTTLRVASPTPQSDAGPITAAAVLAGPTADRAADGKLPPPIETANPAAIPTTIAQQPIPDRAAADLERLYATNLPPHDYFTAAEELGRVELGERTTTALAAAVGDRATFHTADGPRQAELIYLDDLAAYWVETGLTLDRAAIAAAAERLRAHYYPILTRAFGQEWRPGVDGDPRFTVFHVLGASDTVELGYFIDENEYPRALFADSNEREMIYLNMARLEPGTALYDGTLVHEVQHLIQWNLDGNEDRWLNEGLSQVAETLLGLDTVDPHPFLEQTQVRLDRWGDESEALIHYANSYLFVLYLWEQLGDAALSELARHPANGLAAVRAVLAGHRPSLPLEEFAADWATALYLDGRSPDPRYTIQRHELAPLFLADRARQLPYEAVAALDPFAFDVIDLDFSGPATITFAGDTVAPLLDPPPDGGPVWFAPPGDSSRAQLTAAVDLASDAAASFSFLVWHDLEPGYDFAYLSISTDGGQTWRLLAPEQAQVGAYGPAWGGRSAEIAGHANGWLRQTIDLSPYRGQQIQLRFDVVTDFEQFGRGFAISEPVVTGASAPPVWEADGFVETGANLPQRWAVRLIREGQTPEVVEMALDGLNRGQMAVELGPVGGALIVMPLTPYGEGAADYRLAVSR